MDAKKRILIVENSIHITGALKSVCRTAFDLKQFYDFVFILPKGSKGRSWIEAKGFNNIYELPFVEISKRVRSLLLYFPRLLRNALSLKRIVEKERIDLVHVNDLYNLVLPAARLIGVRAPYICHIRFLPEKFPKLLFNSWFGLHATHAKRIIAVSHYLYDQLPYDEKLSVIYNELPVEERYPNGLSKLRAPTILYLSNVIKGKGHDFAIEAFAKLHKLFPHWRLRFVGGDMGLKKNSEYRKHLQDLACARGLADKTDWIDFTEDVEKEYKQAEIALNFSESESFSITCLEALFYGCPIVATHSGGPAEIIDHEITGYLVAKGDLDSMVAYVRKLMEDPALRNRLMTEGRKIVRDRFNISNTSYKLKLVYDDALNKRT